LGLYEGSLVFLKKTTMEVIRNWSPKNGGIYVAFEDIVGTE
jgi:hypothetical protein